MSLSGLIKKLSKEEVRMFKLLLSRVDTPQSRKGEEMFDLMRKGPDLETGELAELLYGKDSPRNRNNLYAIRNRLNRELLRSLNFQHFDLDGEQRCLQIFSLGRVLRKKGQPNLARDFFDRALKEADKNDLFQLKEMIFQELLTLSAEDLTIDVPELIARREANTEKLRFSLESQNTLAYVIQQLRKSNFSQSGTDILQVMEEARDRLAQYASMFNSPKGRFRIFNLTSQMLLQAQAFEQLEIYLKSEYQDFQEKEFFTRDTHRTKIIMLIWLINTTFKCYKFEESIGYGGELKQALEAYNRRYYKQFILNYYLGLVNNYSCLGQTERALNLLRSVSQREKEVAQSDVGIYIYINLANVLYERGAYRDSLRTISKIYTHPHFEGMDQFNHMLIQIFELVVRYENGDHEFLLTRLEKMRKMHRDILDQYSHQRNFMRVLKDITEEALHDEVNWDSERIQDFMKGDWEFMPGENEIVNYRLWLQCHRQNRPYPEVMVEKINAQRAVFQAHGTRS